MFDTSAKDGETESERCAKIQRHGKILENVVFARRNTFLKDHKSAEEKLALAI